MELLNTNRFRIILLLLFIITVYSQHLPNAFAAQEDIAQDTLIDNDLSISIEVDDREVITKIFRLENLDIEKAKDAVGRLLSKDENIKASVKDVVFSKSGKEFTYLAITDTPLKLQQIINVLESMEKEYAPIKVDLSFVDTPLSQVLTTISQVTGLNIVGGDDFSQPITVHLKNVPVEEVLDVILKSTEFAYLKDGNVLHIVPRGDLPLGSEIFELEYVAAEQVKEAISHLVTSNGEIKVFPKFSEAEYSNVLLVTDVPTSIEQIALIIKKLDKKIKQVMIEAKFVEVKLDEDSELGIEWLIDASFSGSSKPTEMPFTDTGRGPFSRSPDLEADSTALTTGTISFADFSATVHALDTDTEINIISSPRIATREGEQAEIVIADITPIPIYERNEETGSIEITGYQDEDIGIVLRVTPIINIDNTVTLRVNPEVSEATGTAVGPNDERPIVSTREITTVFTVENGKTVVLGGLMKKKTTNTSRKIPFLGSIPIVGRIFTYNDDELDTTELLVFITPHIIDEAGAEKVVDVVLEK